MRRPAGHPIFARCYARLSAAMERGGMAEHRRHLLSGVSGAVIEVGAGNGMNFAHYPGEVDRVLAVEPEPYLRRLAADSAVAAPAPVEVVAGDAGALPAADATFDVAIASLVLCSVPGQSRALAEIRRVLRPGGRLRFLEHVAAPTAGLRRVQRALDATVWPRLAAGCRSGRDTVAAIEGAGFAIESLREFRFPAAGPAFPTSPHVLGTAVRTDRPR